MIVAIIPARGGSKRIPHKNIKDFFGRPLISYAVNAALESKVFDKIIVSTDCEKIARAAREAGAEVPFMRPNELADDHTHTVPVLLHALNWLQKHGVLVNYFCLMYSNPFITGSNIAKSFYLLKEKKAASVIPVTTYSFPIFKSFKIAERGNVEFVFPKYSSFRTQDLPEACHDVGQFYWCDCNRFLEREEVLQEDTIPFFIPRHLSQDLDSPEDWEAGEKLYQAFMTEG